MKITFIEMDPRLEDRCSRLIMPRSHGMVLVATILRNHGYDVKVYCENIHPIDMRRVEESSVVCFTSQVSSANKTFALADFVRDVLHKPTVIGGVFSRYFTDLCLKHIDYVVRDEGDQCILELINAIVNDGDVSRVKGISYRGPDNSIVSTGPCERSARFPTIPDYSLIVGYNAKPRWYNALVERRLRWMVLEASRGCPNACDFCIVPDVYGNKYRTRDMDSVINDINDKLKYGNVFLFMDNCFTGDRNYAKKLLKRIIDKKMKIKTTAFTRVEATRDDELLALMKEAGMHSLIVGAETVDDDVFVKMEKNQTKKDLIDAVRKIKSHGMRVSLTFLVGYEYDDQDALTRAVDFTMEHEVDCQVFLTLWSWPESKKPLLPKYRMIIKNMDYVNGSYVVHFPLNQRPSDLQRKLFVEQRRFVSYKRIFKYLMKGRLTNAFYLFMYRYSLTNYDKETLAYADYLESIESDYYDDNGCLNLEKVKSRKISYDGEFDEIYKDRLIGRFTGVRKKYGKYFDGR